MRREGERHLAEDASDGPNIDGLGVSLGIEHDLGCSIPSASRPIPSNH
jgi:hypothetical protein